MTSLLRPHLLMERPPYAAGGRIAFDPILVRAQRSRLSGRISDGAVTQR